MKKTESGRSMIEMLGVLAIIGVLSIGGLAGYTMAMNRYRANEILDYARSVAVSVQTVGQGNTAVSNGACKDYVENREFPGGTTACTVTFVPSTDTTTVVFTGISDNVKSALLSRLTGSNLHIYRFIILAIIKTKTLPFGGVFLCLTCHSEKAKRPKNLVKYSLSS